MSRTMRSSVAVETSPLPAVRPPPRLACFAAISLSIAATSTSSTSPLSALAAAPHQAPPYAAVAALSPPPVVGPGCVPGGEGARREMRLPETWSIISSRTSSSAAAPCGGRVDCLMWSKLLWAQLATSRKRQVLTPTPEYESYSTGVLAAISGGS
eukprot:2112732-Prymnesium_polylepis.1